MKQYFDIIFLPGVIDFINNLDDKVAKKILYNMDRATYFKDSKLFKKLEGDIWEFRTKFSGNQYRILAFWDKTNNKKSLVLCTHGIVKKNWRLPKEEIKKAISIRKNYYNTGEKNG